MDAHNSKEIKWFLAAGDSCLFILLFCCGSIFPSIAQVRYQGDTVYKFSQNIIRNIHRQNPDFARAAQDFSFIGDYKTALYYAEKLRQPFPPISDEVKEYFQRFKPVDAIDYVLAVADTAKIIMINEAHHIAYHRTFIRSLLQGLYKRGFRYYGAETINMGDTLLNKRKSPILTSGYYTVEPEFGNLIRQALSLGFRVFGYEARSAESFGSPKAREIEQAQNIWDVLKSDPNAKILIHAGYDHIREDSLGGSWEKAMARRFKDLSGIDPITLNQVALNETADPNLENPFYKLAEANTPVVFVNATGHLFSGPEGTQYFDGRIYHPRTRYINNRPHWLYSFNRKPVYLNDKELSIGYPRLLQAYRTNENPASAVPLDVIEIKDSKSVAPLMLSPGNYTVIMKGISGKNKEIHVEVK